MAAATEHRRGQFSPLAWLPWTLSFATFKPRLPGALNPAAVTSATGFLFYFFLSLPLASQGHLTSAGAVVPDSPAAWQNGKEKLADQPSLLGGGRVSCHRFEVTNSTQQTGR